MDIDFCENAIDEGRNIIIPMNFEAIIDDQIKNSEFLKTQNREGRMFFNAVNMVKYLSKMEDQYKKYKNNMLDEIKMEGFDTKFDDMENDINQMYAKPIGGSIQNKRIRRQKTKKRRRSTGISRR